MTLFDTFIIDPAWILNIRTEWFTTYFKAMRFISNDAFYIVVIALGYWLRPLNLFHISLGFLIPFSTIFNGILKNIFQLARPDSALHMIDIPDPFGFPSGDVQVATVFWASLFLQIKNKTLKYACFLPLASIAFSRMYLGMHSIYDVIAGLSFGLCSVYIWNHYLKEKLITQFNNTAYRAFWVLIAIYVAFNYFLLPDIKMHTLLLASLGALIGFGLSLPRIYQIKSPKPMLIVHACLALVSLMTLTKLIPIPSGDHFLKSISIILKYGFIIFSIFVLIPKISIYTYKKR